MKRYLACFGLFGLLLAACSRRPAAPVAESVAGPALASQPSKPSMTDPGAPSPYGTQAAQPNAAIANPAAATAPAPVASAEPASPPSAGYATAPPAAGSPNSASSTAPVSAISPSIRIPAGVSLRVRTASTLSTKSARPGERFEAWLSEPLTNRGVTVAPKGSRVEGMVAESNPGGRIHGRAALSVRLTAVELHGRMIPIQTGLYRRIARGTKSRDAMKIGGGAGVGAAIGAIAAGGVGAGFGALAGAGAGTGVVLATRGAPAVIPSESLLAFQLRTPLTVAN